MSTSVAGQSGKQNPSRNTSAVPEDRSDLQSLASFETLLLFRGVGESANAFPPLKSAVGDLYSLLNN